MGNMEKTIIEKLIGVLEATLEKIARFDENSMVGKIMSFAVSFERFFSA